MRFFGTGPSKNNPSRLFTTTALLILATATAFGQGQLSADPTTLNLLAPAPGTAESLREDRPRRLQSAIQVIERSRYDIGASANDTFIPVMSSYDRLGRLIVRYERRYQSLPVIGGGVKVAVNPSGDDGKITRSSNVAISIRNVVPTVGEVRARELIATRMGVQPAALHTDMHVAILADRGVREPLLIWRVEATAPRTEATVFYMDAHTGEILRALPKHIHDQATGHSQYSGTVNFYTEFHAGMGKYKLQDMYRGGTFVYDVQDRVPDHNFHGEHFWDSNNSWGNGQDWKLGDPTDSPVGQTAAVDAFYFALRTWDLLYNIFGRFGVADDGEPFRLRVHYRKEDDKLYGDANWDGYFANFGDGKTSDSKHRAEPETVSHELGHAFWQAVVGPYALGEAGGLNEGHGDIMAAAVQHYVNLAGGQGNFVPTAPFGDLSHFRSRIVNPLSYSAGGEQGLLSYVPDMGSREVHTQGCAYGRMFVMLAVGAPSHEEYDQGPGCSAQSGAIYDCLRSGALPGGMAGIGMHKALLLWEHATSVYFPETPTFADARQAYLDAATDIFGAWSPEYKSVMNAFRGIGVGDPAPDLSAPVLTLWNPVVDEDARTVFFHADADDDTGVDRIEVVRNGVTRTRHLHFPFRGYIDLGDNYGTNYLTGIAHDNAGRTDEEQKSFVFKGANYLIANRGFESQGADWVESAGVLFPNDPAGAFLGSRYASLDGTDWIRHLVAVPAEATSCKIGYRVRVNPGGAANPLLVQLVHQNLGSVDTTLQSIAPETDTSHSDSNNYKAYTHSWNSCAGKTRWLRFLSTMADADHYRIDQVYVTYKATPAADFVVDVDETERTVIFEMKNIRHIQPDQISQAEFASPGLLPVTDTSAPFYRIMSTSEFVTNANYNVQGALRDQGGVKVYQSPVLPFQVKSVQHLLSNPGMESGGLFWTTFGDASFYIHNPAAGQGAVPFQGSGMARFQGSGYIQQQASIPGGVGSARLTFRLRILNGNSQQILKIGVKPAFGGTETIVGTIYGNTDTNAGTSHNYYRRFTYNLSAWMGQTVRIRLISDNSSASPMQFFVDNIGLTHQIFGVTD